MAEVLPFPSLPEVPASNLPPDFAAREQALDIRRSFIVEAPAGSGKTGLLIQRFLKLLTDPAVSQPEQVLAITFTLKATAEMRDRVLGHLDAARRNAPLPPSASDFDRQTRDLALAVLERDRALEWSLLDDPGRLRIRTIDSLCAEIARTLPVLSGSGGRLKPIEGADLLCREAARRTILQLGGSDTRLNHALRDLLLHRDGNLADCESLIAQMLQLREQWGELLPLDDANLDDQYLDSHMLPAFQETLEGAVSRALAKLCNIFPPDLLAELSALAAEMSDCLPYGRDESPLAPCAHKSKPPGYDAHHLDQWKALVHLLVAPSSQTWRRRAGRSDVKFEIEKHHSTRLVSLIGEISNTPNLLEALCAINALPSATYPAEQWAVAKSLFRVLNRALVQLQLVFAEHNQCDFTEPSLLARHALRLESGTEDLSSALGARLQHLLVDEMQDTSTGQYDLLQLLTASWDGHSQTVFLVGDPRQSIYLFRQARVERFIHALDTCHLGDVPLTHLKLTANFRSQQALVEDFNEDFGLIFPQSEVATDLPYSSAQAVLPLTDAAARKWHIHPISYVSKTTASSSDAATSAKLLQDQHECDAKQILHIARSWFAKQPPPNRRTIRNEAGETIPEPWRIAVLVSNRNHLAEIVHELQRTSLRFRAIDIDALNERQEVLDLAALTRALLHPADRVATLAVLRAPWCGLSLVNLHTLTGADDATLKERSLYSLLAERGHLLPADARLRLQRVQQTLQGATRLRGRLTVAQFVERAWRSLGGDTWLNEAQLLNARRFFQLLDEMDADAGSHATIDLTQFEARLQRLYAEPEPMRADEPYVELLTIHKAKGLEWDVVFVPALEGKGGANRQRLLSWFEFDDEADSGASPVLLAPISRKGDNPEPLAAWLEALHRQRESAERKRLFYVACTRARQELHLFAAPPTRADGSINPYFGNLLKAAWPAAEQNLPTPPSIARLPVPTEPGADETGTDDALEIAAEEDDHAPDDESSAQLSIAFSPKDTHRVANPAVIANLPALQRLPLSFDPAARFVAARSNKLPYGDTHLVLEAAEPQFERPEGSLAARSFGTIIHAAMDLFARRILDREDTPDTLLASLPTWVARFAALLRSDGLPRHTLDRLVRETRAALETVLRDPQGLWLLSPHSSGATEIAVTAWPAASATSAGSIRADRIFNAGPEPCTSGDSHLWIVDYKTATHSNAGLEAFLDEQRATYAPQLEGYAQILAPWRSMPSDRVRLALYFPTLARLIWWPLESTAN